MTTLAAGYDFLGKLGDDLRDLIGLDTLVYELIQNADDAPRATAMSFDVSQNLLRVWNDGVFSDCGRQEKSLECECVEDQTGERVRCDFHSLRLLAGQAKRAKVDTTGAFGIGFTSVFQVCDYPELISRGRHWVLRYDRPESERIDVCDGCERDHEASGTTFLLPWARDADSPVRRGLKMDPISPELPADLLHTAVRVIPAATVFLRKLRRVTVLQDGADVSVVERCDEGPIRSVKTGSRAEKYWTSARSFEADVAELRNASAAFTDDVRGAEVELAVPLAEPEERVPLHVVLPTREETELSFRVSAPFFPFQNRKSVRFETDAESSWNRAAVQAAAAMIADQLAAVVKTLPPQRLWAVIRSMNTTWKNAELDAIDRCFATFWEEFLEVAEEVPTVATTSAATVTPSKAMLVPRALEFADDLLQGLEFSVVAPAIRPDVSELAEPLGVPSLSAEAVANAMKAVGLDVETPFDALPPMLASPDNRTVLYRLLDRLLATHVRSDRPDPITVIDGAAVIPTLRRSLAPPKLVALEPRDVVELFGDVPGLLFADAATLNATSSLSAVLKPLSAVDVIDALHELPERQLQEFLERTSTSDLIRWFEDRRAELDATARQRLAELAIFPSSTGGYLPLTSMQLPGNFNGDPLGVVTLVDLTELERQRAFLEHLDAKTLDFDIYAKEILPAEFSKADFAPSADALDDLLDVLDGSRAAIADDEEVRAALGRLEIVSCQDGARRAATRSYFDSDVVRAVLGESQVVAIPSGRLLRLRGTLELLGVNHEPDPSDVIAAVERIAGEPKTAAGRKQIRAVVDFLAPQFRRSDDGSSQLELSVEAEYDTLREFEWLPVEGEDAWALPHELFRTEFRQAFSSTARFIDLPQRAQEAAADFLRYLDVGYRPSPDQVVAHIENCQRDRSTVHVAAYRFLNDAGSDGSYERLKAFDSICLADEPPRFVSPEEAVAGQHALGRYLVELPDELKVLTRLIDGLGIPEAPDDVRAAGVLEALAEEYADLDKPIGAEREVLSILRECWRILERERKRASRAEDPDDETLDEYDDWLRRTVSDLPSWPDGKERLEAPNRLLIDDMHPLATSLPVTHAKRLIQFPREAPTALLAAGVRALSSVVETELLEAANRRDGRQVSRVLDERRGLIARVVAANLSTGDSVDDALARLDAIRLYETDTLKVEHTLVLDEDVLALGPQSVSAYLDREAGALYVLANRELPASEVAVQLTPLLCPSARPDAVAPALKGVLAATTPDEAERELGLFGFADLDREVAERVLSKPAHVAADEDADHDDDSDELDVEDDVESESESDQSAIDSPAPEAEAEAEADEIVTEADREDEFDGVDSEAVPEPRQVRGDDTDQDVERPSLRRGRARRTTPRREPKPRTGVETTPWRTWVSGGKGAEADAREEHPERVAARRKVEEAGVARVIQYERDHGREATPMPPNNRGFDLESRKGPGRPVLREIEVKSLGSSWEAEWGRGGNPPQLSRPQFMESVDNGRRWLYVVENALDDDGWGIYPIQQVGLKATSFLFDHGWKEGADQPDAPGLDHEIPEPKLPSVDGRTWPQEGADPENDIPFVPWDTLPSFLEGSEEERVPSRWYAPPDDVGEADWATQQIDYSMGALAPFGSILTIRKSEGDFVDGQVVLANVGDGDGQRLAVRRAFQEIDADGVILGVLLESELPTAEQYALPAEEVAARLYGTVICVDAE
jgi:hypothetical protein